MTTETPRWLDLLDQLGADQVATIQNLDYSRPRHGGRPHHVGGDAVTAEEWDAQLREMAKTGALLKRCADLEFEGVSPPEGAASVDMPVHLPAENDDDGSLGGAWIRRFTGSRFDGNDWRFFVEIRGYQRTDGTVERCVVTTVEDLSVPDVENTWREEIIDVVDARERASLIVAACDEIDRLALGERPASDR